MPNTADLDLALTTDTGPLIRVLPPAVTSRIAAGEVVERPASVVKELVENALDAGAARITVDIAGGGLDLVRVSDDGRGMSPADLKLCVLEHATSKIRSADELPLLTTLGFRGEALPSIASIAHFSITTRTRQALSASRIEIDGGEPAQPEVKDAAGAYGTTVEARDLFYNLPARKKFLKGPGSEAAACTDTLLRLALTRPDAGFTLLQDRREVFSVAPVSPVTSGTPDAIAAAASALRHSTFDIRHYVKRARELLGRSNTEQLLELDAIGTAREIPGESVDEKIQLPPGAIDLPEIPAGYRVYGLISPPAITRPNRSAVYLTVNGRPVKDRTLTSALMEAYRHLLPPKRYPLAVLFFELPGADVDANVHPTKTEVRFRIPGLVYALLHHAIRRACGNESASVYRRSESAVPAQPHVPLGAPRVDDKQKTFDLWPRADGEVDCGLRIADCGLAGDAPGKVAPLSGGNVVAGTVATSGTSAEAPGTVHEAAAPYSAPATAKFNPPLPSLNAAARIPTAALTPSNPQSAIRNPQSPPPKPPAPFRVLGQAGGAYIVLEDDTGVKLIDQHALHERVLFEVFLKKAHSTAQGEAQGLLVPQVFDLTPVQLSVFTQDDAAQQLLSHLGFSVDLFGDRAIAVRAVPALFRSASKAALVLDVLDALSETSDADPSLTRAKHRYSFREKAAYMLACKGALKAGERLTIEQMTALVEDYRRCAGPHGFTCPHGRPVALELGWDELEKAVGRV